MNRRTFLKAAAAVPMVAAVPAIVAPAVETFVNPAVGAMATEIPHYLVFFGNRIWCVTTSSGVSFSQTLDYWEAA